MWWDEIVFGLNVFPYNDNTDLCDYCCLLHCSVDFLGLHTTISEMALPLEAFR